MSDIKYSVFQHYGTAAQRAAFVPAPAAGIQPLYFWYETDTGLLYLFTSGWVLISAGASSAENPILWSILVDKP